MKPCFFGENEIRDWISDCIEGQLSTAKEPHRIHYFKSEGAIRRFPQLEARDDTVSTKEPVNEAMAA